MTVRRVINSRFDPFSETTTPLQITEAHHTIRDSRVQLKEAVDIDHDVTILDVATSVAMTEVTTVPNAGEFRVDKVYNTGLIQFNSADNDSDIDIDYYGVGSPAVARDHNWGGGGNISIFPSGFGGDGSDGSADITGNTNATKELYEYTDLRLDAVLTSITEELIIGVQGRLTVTSSGKINAAGKGGAGGAGGTSGAGSGGQGSYALGKNGATGGSNSVYGFQLAGGGGGGGAGGVTADAGGSGGAGFIGGAGGTGVGSAGQEAFNTNRHYSHNGSNEPTIQIFKDKMQFIGGGPGGGGGGNGSTGNGGAGGAGGGSVYIECDELYLEDDAVLNPWIRTSGVDGSNGSNNGGGGGGGGGACCFIICNRILGYNADPATRQSYLGGRIEISGGAAGTSTGGNGGAGASGMLVIIELDPEGRD